MESECNCGAVRYPVEGQPRRPQPFISSFLKSILRSASWRILFIPPVVRGKVGRQETETSCPDGRTDNTAQIVSSSGGAADSSARTILAAPPRLCPLNKQTAETANWLRMASSKGAAARFCPFRMIVASTRPNSRIRPSSRRAAKSPG